MDCGLSDSSYGKLCQLVDTEPYRQEVELANFSSFHELSHHSFNQRLAGALQIVIDIIDSQGIELESFDRSIIDHFIARVDVLLSQQLDEILHHSDFQDIESMWRSIHYVMQHIADGDNVKVELLDIDKSELEDDFNDAIEIAQSGLFKQLYQQEYDMPGGEPFGALISQYEFGNSARDIHLLGSLSQVCASIHAPFIAAASSEFFGKKNFGEVMRIDDIELYLQRPEYIRWNSLRERDDARYLGLTLPKFLLRLPYGDFENASLIHYNENVIADHSQHYLWANASFAFAANLIKSFRQQGWCVNIRGPEAGGKVANLPMHHYQFAQENKRHLKIPTETLISESCEMKLAALGFIPLSYYKNQDFACFFSANSIHQIQHFSSDEAQANSRINARLPYVFLSSRLAHYLKVLQRENIGASKNRIELEKELNDWLKTLVTTMKNPSALVCAQHPLSEGFVEVIESKNNPGFYRVVLYATPHFQIEGMDVRLSLVSQLPSQK